MKVILSARRLAGNEKYGFQGGASVEKAADEVDFRSPLFVVRRSFHPSEKQQQ